MRYLRNPARTVTAASLKTEEATGVNGQTNIALKIHFVSTAAHHFGDGSLATDAAFSRCQFMSASPH